MPTTIFTTIYTILHIPWGLGDSLLFSLTPSLNCTLIDNVTFPLFVPGILVTLLHCQLSLPLLKENVTKYSECISYLFFNSIKFSQATVVPTTDIQPV